jgi:hypothetical protein
MLRIGAYTRREETDNVNYSIVPVVANFAFVRLLSGLFSKKYFSKFFFSQEAH